MLRSLTAGLRTVLGHPGLPALTLAAELGLALPLASVLRAWPLPAAGLWLLLESFLDGGLLGVFRAPAAGWKLRGFLRGCPFYFFRLLWISLVAACLAAPLLLAAWPLAQAATARTGTVADLALGSALLAALAIVHAVSAHARVILVSEQRRSPTLALASSLGFCARNLPAVGGQYLVVGAVSSLLALGFVHAWPAEGVARIAEAARIGTLAALAVGVRLALLAAQAALHQARGR
jgi:hypothetical protein